MNSYWFDTVMQLGHGVGQREMCSWRDHLQKSGIAICKGVREDPVVTVVSNSLSVLVCPHDFFSSFKKKNMKPLASSQKTCLGLLEGRKLKIELWKSWMVGVRLRSLRLSSQLWFYRHWVSLGEVNFYRPVRVWQLLAFVFLVKQGRGLLVSDVIFLEVVNIEQYTKQSSQTKDYTD